MNSKTAEIADKNTEIESFKPGSLIKETPTGTVFSPKVSYEVWAAYGEMLQKLEKSIRWRIGDWLNYGEANFSDKYSQAMDSTNLSYDSLIRSAVVSKKFPNWRRRQSLGWSHHREVLYLEEKEQNHWLDYAEKNGLGERDLRGEIRKAKRAERIGNVIAPPGKFNLIYADPPWEYEHIETESRAIENHYPTMKLKDICDVKFKDRGISDITADDCILFMWATNPKLEEALEVLNAWGFQYRTNMAWVKRQIGMGYYVRQRHELLLIGKKGDIPVPPEDVRPSSVYESDREGHSKKPDAFYEFIEAMYPTLLKAEFFGRNEREGWKTFGNQLGE